MHDLLPRLLGLLDSDDDGERAAARDLLDTFSEHHRPHEPERTRTLDALRAHLDEPELVGTLAKLVLAGGAARRWNELAVVVERCLSDDHADSAAQIVMVLVDAGVAVPEALVRRVLAHATDEASAELLATWLEHQGLTDWTVDYLAADPERLETLPGPFLLEAHRRAPTAHGWLVLARRAPTAGWLELVGADWGPRETAARQTLAHALDALVGDEPPDVVQWLARWSRCWHAFDGHLPRSTERLLEFAASEAVRRTLRSLQSELDELERALAGSSPSIAVGKESS
jgi:hypothetical protein